MNLQPDLAESLFDPDALHLTKKQTLALPGLRELLASTDGNAARAMTVCDGSQWENADMRELEKALLRVVSRKDLAEYFQALVKIVDRYRTLTGTQAPYPRSLHLVRLEKNPYRNDIGAADDLISRVDALVSNDSNSPDTLLIRAILACMTRFRLLHKSMLIAMVEALAQRSNSLIKLNKQTAVWMLSLAWMGEENAERRLFVPDLMTGTLLARVKVADLRQRFARGLDSEVDLKSRHAAIWEELKRMTAAYLAGHGFGKTANLNNVLTAARSAAYLHLPAAIAAHRCRKSVSHAPPIHVLQRILGEKQSNHQISLQPGGKQDQLSLGEAAQVDAELDDRSDAEPAWMVGIRNAFRQTRPEQIEQMLLELEEDDDKAGARVAKFSRWLLTEKNLSVSSTKRNSLLVARRLGCRLAGIDPADLDIEELERLYWEVIDDDFDRDQPARSELADRRSRRAAIGAVKKFHRHLVEKERVPDFQELAFLKRSGGLLPVDANFITIDEYEKVLEAIAVEHELGRGERRALRLIVMLAFRCGLRRGEVLFLTSDDFDDADFLHIRNNKFRKLKTPNARRSLPLPALLSVEELSDLKSWIEWCREFGDPILIFGRWRTDEEDFRGQDWVDVNPRRHVETIHGMIRRTLGDNSLKMHHLRHSFATLLIARLLPNMQMVASRLFGRHPKTTAWLQNRDEFRQQLFGTLAIRSVDFEAVAHLLGHSSPGTSVEHYIHCLDWYMQVGESHGKALA